MAEAQACGTPVVGYASGGALDIVEEGVTGWLVARQRASDVRAAVERALREPLQPARVRESALRFSEAGFRTAMRQVVEDVVSDRRPVKCSS